MALPLLVVLGALSAFGPLSMDLYLPALPELADDLGSSASLAQLTMTSCMIGLASGQLVVGPLSDRFGRRVPLLVGVSLYVVASVLCTVAPSMAFLVVVRFLQGFTGGAGIVIARAVVRDVCDTESVARVFSLLMLVTGVAPVVAPVLGGQLLAVGSWRTTFAALVVIGGLLLAGTVALVGETHPRQDRVAGGTRAVLAEFGAACRDRDLMVHTAVLGLGTCVLFCYISMSPFVLQDHFGLSAQQFSLVFAMNSVGLILGSQVSGRLVGRWTVSRLLWTGLLSSLAGTLLLVVVAASGLGLPLFLLALLAAVSPISTIMANATALGLAGQGRRAGTASGVMGMAQFALGGLVAPVVTAVSDSPTAMAVGMAASGGLATLVLGLHGRAARSSVPRSDADESPAPDLAAT